MRLDGQPDHGIVRAGIAVLDNLDHRGAPGSDPDTGDGAGILTQLPDALLRAECAALGIERRPRATTASAMFFLPRDPRLRLRCEELCARITAEEGHRALGWRDVPVAPTRSASHRARLVARASGSCSSARTGSQEAFERTLFVIRRRRKARRGAPANADDFYVASSSSNRTLVYKGLMLAEQLGEVFLELADPRAVSRLAVVHSRFSTNTFPSWERAHPYRRIAHNGEINTLRGNRTWMAARESLLHERPLGAAPSTTSGRSSEDGSDSAALDNVARLPRLVMSGRGAAARR